VSLLPLIFGTTAVVAVAAAPISIDVTFDGRATAGHGGSVVVRGTVTCSFETTASIEGQVVEAFNKSEVASGEFAIDVPCEPTPTSWTAVVAPDTEQVFRPGFASATVRAVVFDPESGIFAGAEAVGFLHLTRSAH
jgi:hypothetical protein